MLLMSLAILIGRLALLTILAFALYLTSDSLISGPNNATWG